MSIKEFLYFARVHIMKMKFGLKKTATLLLLTALSGMMAGCSNEQDNDPLVSVDSNNIIQVNNGLVGSITTSFAGEGAAKLSDIKVEVPGCDINTSTIDGDNAIDYPNNDPVVSDVNVTFTSSCVAKTLKITGKQKAGKGDIEWSGTATFVTDSSGGGTPIDPNAPEIVKTLEFVGQSKRVKIGENSQSGTFRFYALTAFRTAVTSGEVTVQLPANPYIVITNTTATISNGIAEFNYEGPADISALNGTVTDQYLFYVKNQSPLVADSIDFNITVGSSGGSTSPIISTLLVEGVDGTSGTPTVSVTQNGQVSDIAVVAVDSNGNYVTEGEIAVSFPGQVNVGTFEKAVVAVSADGKAHFKYIGPANLNLVPAGVANVTFTFSDVKNSSVKANLQVDFSTKLPTINVEASSLVVSQDNAVFDVRVLAYDEFNQTYNSGTIVVEYPTAIVNGSVNAGHFVSSEVALEDGVALFSFEGPDSLTNIADQVFTFKYKEDPTKVQPTTLTMSYKPESFKVVLTEKTSTITTNSQSVSIAVKVLNSQTNAPAQSGIVHVVYPDEVLDGVDVGYFATSNVAVNSSGIASFSYTAPKDLESQVASGNDNVAFSFYYENNLVDAADNNYTVIYNPDANQIIQTDYFIKSSIDDENVTIGLELNRNLTFRVEDKDGVTVSDGNMTSMRITMLNPDVGDIFDSLGADANGKTISNKNNVVVTFKSGTYSGISPLKIETVFTDVNGNEQNRTKIYSVVVLSGPPTAMSINYGSSELDPDGAHFIEHMVVLVTDKYNNPVNTQPSISVGAIVGYARENSGAQDTIVGNDYAVELTPLELNGTSKGKVTITDGNPGALITAPDISETNIDEFNDNIATFGPGYTYDASGKWDITDITNQSSDEIRVLEDFNGTQTKMGYAIGNNKRQELCDDTGAEAVATTEIDGGVYQIDSSGIAKIKIVYDFYLVGKTAAIYANTVGKVNEDNVSKRVGETRIHTFRGSGYSFPFAAGRVTEKSGNVPSLTNIIEIYFDNIRVFETDRAMQNGYFSYDIDYFGDAGYIFAIGKHTVSGVTYKAYYNTVSNQWNASSEGNNTDPVTNVSFSQSSMFPRIVDIPSTDGSNNGWKFDYGPSKGIFDCTFNGGYPYVRIYATDTDKTNTDGGSVVMTLGANVVSEY